MSISCSELPVAAVTFHGAIILWLRRWPTVAHNYPAPNPFCLFFLRRSCPGLAVQPASHALLGHVRMFRYNNSTKQLTPGYSVVAMACKVARCGSVSLGRTMLSGTFRKSQSDEPDEAEIIYFEPLIPTHGLPKYGENFTTQKYSVTIAPRVPFILRNHSESQLQLTS